MGNFKSLITTEKMIEIHLMMKYSGSIDTNTLDGVSWVYRSGSLGQS